MLSDRDLIHCLQSDLLGIDPLDRTQIQPASIDLKLGNAFLSSSAGPYHVIDMNDIKGTNRMEIPYTDESFFEIMPKEFILGTTLESVSLSDTLVGRVEGKSSIGRIGLLIHATAGFIDPGFSGQITLELYNLADVPIRLRPGKPICQLSVSYLSSPAINPYGSENLNSKYQNQRGVVSSRYAG